MQCVMCKSPRTLKFVDGFGDRRVFCRGCGRSFLESNFMKLFQQKSLQEFRADSHYNPTFRVMV